MRVFLGRDPVEAKGIARKIINSHPKSAWLLITCKFKTDDS